MLEALYSERDLAPEGSSVSGSENYVFRGGREGYATLYNTNTARELEHMARFLGMARDNGRSIGFNGTFLIEPKPMESMPTCSAPSMPIAAIRKTAGILTSFLPISMTLCKPCW